MRVIKVLAFTWASGASALPVGANRLSVEVTLTLCRVMEVQLCSLTRRP